MNPPFAQLDELPPPPSTDPGPGPAPVQVAALDDLPDPTSQFVAQAPVSFWNRPITSIAQGIGSLFVDKPQGLQVSPQAVELMALEQHVPRDVAAEVLRASGAEPDTGSQIYSPAQVGHFPHLPGDPTAQEALWRAAATEGRTSETRAHEAERLAPFPAALRPLLGGGRMAGDALVTAALYGGSFLGGDDTRTVLADQAEQASARQAGRDQNNNGLGRTTERAAGTVLQMLATPGGAGAKITEAALTQGGQSYADAIQAGLPEEEARQYAAKQAIAEAVPAAIMSAGGLGGVERAVSELPTAVGGTLRAKATSLLKDLARTIIEEQPEEIATTLAQQQLQTQIDPHAMDNDQLASALGQTVAQTALAGAFSHAPEAIGAAFDAVHPGEGAPSPMPAVVATQPRPAPRLPAGIADQLTPEDIARIAKSNAQPRSLEPVAPEEARANTEADLEQGGFHQVPGVTPEMLAEIAKLVSGQQPAPEVANAQAPVAPEPVAPAAGAVEAPAPVGAKPVAPAPADPGARAAAEARDVKTADTFAPDQPVDVKVGREVHQGTVASVNADGTVAVRIANGRVVPNVPAYRVIPRAPEASPAAPEPAPTEAKQQTIPTDTAPAVTTPPTHVDVAAADAHPAPTEGQKEAGNYQKGHVRIHGMDVSIENAKGSERSGTDANGKPWSVTMPAHYGYVRGTLGADGDQVDVYVGQHPERATVYVVDQIDPKTGKFDEHKAMLGFESKAAAVAAYDAAFSDGNGPQRRGAVTSMPVATFKKWAASRQAKKPLRYQESQRGNPPSQPAADQAPAPSGVPPVAGRVEERPGVAPSVSAPAPESPVPAPAPAEGVRAAPPAPPAAQPVTEAVAPPAPERLSVGDRVAVKIGGDSHEAEVIHVAKDGRAALRTASGARTKLIARDRLTRIAPAPTASVAAPARPTSQPSTTTQAPPSSGPGSDRTQNSRAAEPPAGASPAAGHISDVGEKIGGARKDRLTLDDFDRLTPEEQQAVVTKNAAWPDFDAPAAIAAGMPAEVAHVVHQIRSAIATKPVLTKAEMADPEARRAAIREYLDAVTRIAAALREVRSVEDIRKAYREAFPGLFNSTTWGSAVDKSKEEPEAARKRYARVANSKALGRAFQARGTVVLRARDAVNDGWPAAAPWRTRYEIRKLLVNQDSGTPKEAFRVLAKNSAQRVDERSLPGQFNTREEAEAEAARRYANLTKSGGGKPLVRPLNPDLKRVGHDRRNGSNVSAEDFTSTFGFRGTEFGNWTNQADRQQALNQAFDGLHDLADIMGMPARALSLNGKLGLAFGARGGGRYAAHYESGKVVINLTRTRGAGSLAHEWAHAVDNYFGKLGFAGNINRWLSHSADAERAAKDAAGEAGVRPEVVSNWLRIHRAIHGKVIEGGRHSPTAYLQNSAAKDKDPRKAYWSSEHELFARAFETWVAQRLEDGAATSPYLVQGVPTTKGSVAGEADPEWMQLYPQGEEAVRINDAIDAWARSLKTEETSDGKVRLFAPERTPGEEPAPVEQEPAETALEGPERTPGGKQPEATRPESAEGIEALVRWALLERQKTIVEMKRRAERSGDDEMARDYQDIASQYEAVDPEELAAHMRAYPAHYLRSISTLGGSMDPVQVFRQRADLPPIEPRVAIAPAPAGETASDLRTTLKTLATDLRKAAPGAPTLAVDRASLPEGSAGEFDTRTGGITIRYHNDLDLVAHEVGHWAAETYELLPAAKDETARAELARFGVHGTAATGDTLLREGMAEYLRAWMVNPGEAEARAPAFTAQVRRQVPPRVLDALRGYGDSVRAFAGAPAVQQVAAGVMPTQTAAKEEKARVRISRLIIDGVKGLFGAGRPRQAMRPGIVPKGFNATAADKARFAITDQQAPQLANYVTSLALVGVDPTKLRPTQHWDYLRKFSRGEAGRLRDMVLEHGLATADLEVAKDPQTGERMTLGWLLDPITELGDRWTSVLDKAHAYGVAERSVELEDRFTTQTENEITSYSLTRLQEAGNDRYAQEKAEREVKAFARQKRAELQRKLARLTAAGGGINNASETARKALSELDQDADQPAIREYLRRYRTWADFNLSYAVRTELLTPQAAERIRQANQAYIDWHRVFGEDDAPINIGEAVEGSARTIHNPLASLMHATWSVVSRGDRNRLMQAFIAPLKMAPTGDQALSRALSTLGRQISEDEAKEAYQKQGGYHDDATGERRRVYRVQRLMQQTNADGSPVMDRSGEPAADIVTEHWVFDSGTEASIEAGRSMLSDHPWMLLMQGLNSLQRHMITLAPGFRFKVPVRDNIERMMNSEARSGVRDMPSILAGKPKLEGRPLDELFSLSGASLAGWNQHTRDSALAEVLGHIGDLRRSKWSVVTPGGFMRWWGHVGEAAENLARKAEFAAAFRKARAQGMETTDASLYAMTQSRGLLDTAEHGYVVGKLNGIALFLNASIKGLQRTSKMTRAALVAYRRGDISTGNRLAATVSLRTVMLGAGFAAARMAFLASLKDDDERKKALREPAWKRDFALRFNLPIVGKIAIPKPYEWGWLASGFERAADAAFAENKGWHDDARRAYEGYGHSFLGAVMPMHEEVIAGSFAPPVEVLTNHSFFTDSHLIPVHEEKLDVDLRKGTANASPLGQLLAKVIPADPRNIDHLIRGYFGGFGSVATARNLSELARRFTGYSGETSIYASRDVQFVMDYTDGRGSSGKPDVKRLHEQLKAAAKETDEAKRGKLENEAIKQAERIRSAIERNPKAYKGQP
jgi:hypothetical protein